MELDSKIQEYSQLYQQLKQESQQHINQANELATQATRLEGAISALQSLQQESAVEDNVPEESAVEDNIPEVS